MKNLFICLFLFSCAHSKQNSDEFTLIHYNIKELTSAKLKEQNTPQLNAVKKILKNYHPDILSINEMQYDLPGIPHGEFKSEGQNLKKLAKKIQLDFAYNVFDQANTGNDAIPYKSGEYPLDFSDTRMRKKADQNNFGIFPGQYSTGALSNLKIIEVKVYKKIIWKDFNPKVNLDKFAKANGKPLNPKIELFDKSFIHAVLETKDLKRLNLILLHTVPAYHFGNKRSPNYERNRDQLRFLEWYLSGDTDIQIANIKENGKEIIPLKKGARFVAVGDWNTDINNKKNSGTLVLERIFTKTQPWIDIKKMNYSNEGYGYGKETFKLMLDYIVTDKKTKIIDGKILQPKNSNILKICDQQNETSRKSVMYRGFIEAYWKEKGKNCRAKVPEDYFDFKQASDHYPLFLKFSL